MKTAVIDARVLFDQIPSASLKINGQTVLERHIQLAKRLGMEEIHVLDDPERKVSGQFRYLEGAGVKFCDSAPVVKALELSTMHIYKETKAKVIWTLRGPKDAVNAQGELERSEFFTISKHTLRPLGKRFAGWLYANTRLTANHLTIGRILAGLIGAGLFSFGEYWANFLGGFCVLFSWFLDLTDGQLARLRNEVSKFGAYLDSVGDGVVDNLYYISIAATLYRNEFSEVYLWLGLGFLFGKYVFVNSTLLAPMIFKTEGTLAPFQEAVAAKNGSWRAVVKKTISILDDTDVRIHFLAVSAALDLVIVPLFFHVIYFNIRWMLNLANAYIKYEILKETR